MTQSFDVVVVGGGVVGLSAAIAMQQRGFSTAIIDAGNPTNNNRVYAINHASERLLTTLGVWQLMPVSALSAYEHMHVWDASNAACIDFDSRMIGGNNLGFIVQESDLKQALLTKIHQTHIVLLHDSCVNCVQSTQHNVCIQVGENNIQANLLIVADGALSTTRQQLGVGVTSRPYHQSAIVGTVQTEKPHQKTAYQVFHPQGALAFLPLKDPHQCSIVWSTSTAYAGFLMHLQASDFAQQLARTFSNTLGSCQLLSPRVQFPLHMRHVERYSGPNWLLMGDAAHTIHPLAGLGLNLGLGDLTDWLALLDANQQHWSSKMLGMYQRQRKVSVWQMIALMDGFKTIFSNPLPPIIALRGLGLNVCNRLPLLKRLFIEHAAG